MNKFLKSENDPTRRQELNNEFAGKLYDFLSTSGVPMTASSAFLSACILRFASDQGNPEDVYSRADLERWATTRGFVNANSVGASR